MINKTRNFEGTEVALDFVDNRDGELGLSEIIYNVSNSLGLDVIAVKRRYFPGPTKPNWVRQFCEVVVSDWNRIESEDNPEPLVDDFVLQPRIAVIGASGCLSLHYIALSPDEWWLRVS